MIGEDVVRLDETRAFARTRLADLRAIRLALFAVAICASGFSSATARADTFTWLGPTHLISTGGAQSIPTLSCPGTGQCTTVDHMGEEITFNPSNGAILTRSAVDIIGVVSSISCPSTAQCTAVDNGGNEITFSPASGTVNAAGRASVDPSHHLTAVSCASGTRCSAVDDHGSEVTFDPSSGAVLGSGANMIDGTAVLKAVSCQPGATGSQQCTAVDNGGNEATFIVANDGTITNSSSPIDGTTALSSVSCPATTQCTAVDGGGFEITFTPSTGALVGAASKIDINAGLGVALTAVACPSTSQCVAVDTLGNEVTFAPTGTPDPSVSSVDGTTFLASVSCASGASSCAATDNHGSSVDFTTAGAATSHQIVAPALAGVSCPTRTQCTAIGSGSSEVTLDPTTGTVNGAGVSAVDLTGNPLSAISCVSATECTAVDSGGNEVTFDPTSGGVFASGTVSVDSSGLRSVACLTTTAATPAPQCTAIDAAGNEVTFNPSTGTINNAGLTPEDQSGGTLESVSCATGSQCTTVDSHGNEVTFNPVSGIYYGSQPAVPVDAGHNLGSVACPTAGQCTAVDGNGGVITFLNPASTPAIPTRQEIEVSNTALMSVSCPSAGQCTAVDGLGQEATFSPASTTLDAALLTPLAGANTLEGVSCQSTSICFVGDAEGNGFAGVQPPVNTTPPGITGTAQEGVQLTSVQGSWTNLPTNYAYQWDDCTSASDASTCSAISGAMSSTYTPVATDIGQFIRVQETATNPGGAPKTVSTATAIVKPAPPTNTAPPTISGQPAQQGQPLTEVQGTWHEDGSDTLAYAYQWTRCSASGAGCAAIAGATAASYTPTAADIGHALVVAEIASNSGGGGVSAASAPTAAVAAAPAAAIAATSLQANPVQTTTATARAQLLTKGVAVTWYFQYGTSTAHLASTAVQSIAAGSSAPVAVSQTISGLKPNTKYQFRIVETVPAGPYVTPTTVDGLYLNFTSRPAGRIALGDARLSVSASGAASVSIACASRLACHSRFAITTKGRHHATVVCAAGSARVTANRTKQIDVGIRSQCLGLLRSARGHRLSATFTIQSQSGQLGLVKRITMVGR